MPRFVAVCSVLVFALPLAAADKPDPAAIPRIVTAKIEGDYLIWGESKTVPVTKEVDILIEVNGKAAVEKVTVTSSETVTVNRAIAVKKVKATDGAGKAIPADKLAERLVADSPVVYHTGPLPEKYRSLFAASAILIEFEPPAAIPPGIAPAKP